MSETFQIGSRVVKNPETWIPTEFDEWGAGIGVGEVVEPPFTLDDGWVDVRWPAGREFRRAEQLLRDGESIPAELPQAPA